MNNSISSEIWKAYTYSGNFVKNLELEVSNYGNIRSPRSKSQNKNLKSSLTNGYASIRFKLMHPRNKKVQEKIDAYKIEIQTLTKHLLFLQNNIYISDNGNKQILEIKNQLEETKIAYSKYFKKKELERTHNYTVLVHRLVAMCFIPKKNEAQQFVAHLDHDKTNNHFMNLAWMTQEEIQIHNLRNPNVIEGQKKSATRIKERITPTHHKLTSTKVMLIKRRIADGIPLRNLSKAFKVSETQLLRIKRGENWKHIKIVQ
jgi:hypothetical protein